MKRLIIIALLFPLSLGLAQVREIRQLSTHPADDFSPVPSPDGRWLVFVSDRSGNLDLWLKPLSRGSARQLTWHVSPDFSPAWSPDSRSIVFVSCREDAAGDIWILKIDPQNGRPSKAGPSRLTQWQGSDRQPLFSRGGRSVIFTSERKDGANLWETDVQGKMPRQLTVKGGSQASLSPSGKWLVFTSTRYQAQPDIMLMRADTSEAQDEQTGKAYPLTWGRDIDSAPRWSYDSRSVVFSRVRFDSNNDGLITPEDRAALWKKELGGSTIASEDIILGRNEFQLSADFISAACPAPDVSGDILFQAGETGKRDIFVLLGGDLFPRRTTAAQQYAQAQEKEAAAVSSDDLLFAILGYQRILDIFPRREIWCARSLLQQSSIYSTLGRYQDAARPLRELIRSYPHQRPLILEAELKLAALPLDPLPERIARLRSLLEEYRGLDRNSAEVHLLLGDLLREAGDKTAAIEAYSAAAAAGPGGSNIVASARLKIGDLLASQNQPETARQTWLSVLRDYGSVPLWRDRAGRRVLEMIQGDDEAQIKQLRDIIEQASYFPSLAVEAQLRISRILTRQNHVTEALRELEQIPALAPMLDWALARSTIDQSSLRARLGQELQAFIKLEEVIEKYNLLEGGRYAQAAQDTLFSLYMRSARRLLQDQDLTLAATRFRRAVSLKPRDIQARRGLLESSYRLGRLPQMVDELEAELADNPTDQVLLYSLGLAYSYLGENNRTLLERSNALLQVSLDQDYRLIYPYRTLGYNYERLEKLRELDEGRERGLAVRAFRLVTSPLRWLAGLIRVGGDKEEIGYYEKAIEVLTTAMELNDEKKDPAMEAALAQNLANNFYNLGEFGFKRAFHYYNYRLELDTTFTSPQEQAVFFERAGRCGEVLDDIDPAISFLHRAVAIYTSLGNGRQVREDKRLLAFLYHLQGQYENAIAIYETLAREDEAESRLKSAEQEYRNAAYNYHLLGEPDLVLENAYKAEKLLEQIGISSKRSYRNALRVEILGFSIPVWSMEEIGGASSQGLTTADEAALVYSLISSSHENQKFFDRAKEYEEKRFTLFQKSGDRLARRISLNRLGVLAFKSADFSQSWNYFLESFQESRKRKDRIGRLINLDNLANACLNQPADSSGLAQLHRTITVCDEELRQRFDPPLNDGEKSRLLALRGSLLTRLAENELSEDGDPLSSAFRALEYSLQADSSFRAALPRARKARQKGMILATQARLYQKTGESTTALQLADSSLSLLSRAGEEDLLWRINYLRAGLQQDSGEEALVDYRLAMDELEAVPVSEIGDEEFVAGRERRFQLYADGAAFMAHQGKPEAGLLTLERGLRRRLSELLVWRPLTFKRERHKIIWGNLLYLRQRCYQDNLQIQTARRNKAPLSQLRELEREFSSLSGEYKQICKELQQEDPVLAHLAGVSNLSLSPVRSLLHDRDGVLIYLAEKDTTLLWLLDSNSLQVRSIPAGRGDILALIQEMNRERGAGETGPALDLLGKTLFKPAEDWIRGKKRLSIIPDRDLWRIPFSALSFQFLGTDSIEINLFPSLTAITLSYQRRKAGLRNGLFVGENSDAPIAAQMNTSLEKTTILLGSGQATEAAVSRSLVSPHLVQLERWCRFNRYDPFRSSFVLFHDTGTDGYLHAWELMDKDIRAALFIIPPGADGAPSSWEGPLAFYWSLLYTGVPTMINRLWPVDRRAANIMNSVFYRDLAGNSPLQAMMLAQRAVRDSLSAPKEWAGYQLIGFQGMNPQERLRFAADNLLLRVREAQGYEQQGEFKRALRLYQEALDMSHLLGDSTLTYNILTLSLSASIQGNLWSEAADYQIQLQSFAQNQGLEDDILTGQQNLAVFYQREGRLEEALQAQKKYIEMVVQQGDRLEEAKASREIAMLLNVAQRRDEAVTWTSRACSLYTSLGMELETGRTLIRQGRILLEGDRYIPAAEVLARGLGILEQGEDQSGLLFEIASGYQLLGLAEERLTRYEKAIKHQETGVDLFHRLGQSRQEAQGLQYLANVYWKSGNLRQAVIRQEEALAIFRKLNDTKLLSVGYSTLGLIKMDTGEHEEAHRLLNQALALAESAGNQADRSTILKNLGLLYIKENRLAQAQSLLIRSAAIDSVTGSTSGLAYSSRNLGLLQVRLGFPVKAIPLLQRSLKLSRDLNDIRNEVQSYYGLGQAYKDIGEHGTAIAYLDSGLILTGNRALPDLEWRLLWQRAQVNRQANEAQAAREDYRRAVEIVESLRGGLGAETLKQGFLEDKMDLYADVIDYLIKRDRSPEAFEYAERAKSRSFLDILGGGTLLPGLSRENLQRERALRDSIGQTRTLLAAADKEGLPDRLNETDLQKRLAGLEERYGRFITSVQTQDPRAASILSIKPATIKQIQDILPDSTLLLEYFQQGTHLFIWSVDRRRVDCREVSVVDSSLTELIRNFRNRIATRLTSDQEALHLYEVLISPAEERLRGATRLVIIPHTVLHYCPFAALQDKDGVNLIDRFSVSLAPSATILEFCHDRAAASPMPKDPAILAVSNPQQDTDLDLPFADMEVASLKRTYEQVEVLSGSAASEAAVKRKAGNFDILHFACHAEFNDQAPLFSSLLLNPGEQEDGRLEVTEIFNLKLSCCLVTLSACESGLGKIAGGDDIIGLSRGFIYAGAPSFISSLWKVDDLSTAVLLKRFYRYLKSGMSKTEALRQAQLWVRDHLSGQPADWAGFTLTGEFE